MRIAIIGIGSNSLRMLIADIYQNNKTYKQIFRDRMALRLFSELSNSSRIFSESCMNKACNLINEMKNKALDHGCEYIDLFATSATRDANNKDEFVKVIKIKCGLNLKILSGDDEAKLSFFGSSDEDKHAIVIDIGGGSTEVAIGINEEIYMAYSLQLGAVRTYEIYPVDSIEQLESLLKYLEDFILRFKDKTIDLIEKLNLDYIIGVGGTFTTLSSIAQSISWTKYNKIDGFVLNFQKIKTIMYELATVDAEERKKILGIQPGRADIIVNGIAILYTCMNLFNIKKVKVSTKGNLEGYLKHYYFNK